MKSLNNKFLCFNAGDSSYGACIAKIKQHDEEKMVPPESGMLNVLIAAVLWGVQVFARSTSCGAAGVVTVPDDDTFVIRRAGLILVTFLYARR
ncbi:hypothetical protein KCP69_03450 [Salmonella enterica subsp. enterica]|nr:hypothetical protein KCP69_03450 [Salmonella enterica subsp. enterica]